jgi:hypothetical protein
MFGRVITKIFKRSATPATKPVEPTANPSSEAASPFSRNAPPAAAKTVEPAPTPEPATTKKSGKNQAPAAPATPSADSVKQQWQSKSGKKLNTKESPEELCGVNKSMTKAEIEDRLAVLYRRHNRAASSLDPVMRDEAEAMLEAIATIKEKYVFKKA